MKKITPKVEHRRVTKQKDTFFKYNGWPSVCIDDRGVLYAVASSMRMSHVDPTGKNCMFLSFDNGDNWTNPIVINDSHVDDRDTGISYLGNGKLIANWFSVGYPDYCDPIQTYDWFDKADKEIAGGFSRAWKKLPPDMYKECTGSFVMLSDDYGVTWSDPIRVKVTAPHGPCVCKDGTLFYMGNVMDGVRRDKRPPVTVYSSTDGGRSWSFTGEVPDGDIITAVNTFEPHVVELPNGRLLGAIRTHCDELDPSFTVFTTYSDDRGKTWSKPVGIGVDGSPPHLMVHSSGAVICSYSCRTDGIRCERAVVSYDNGETWTEDYAIDDRLDRFCDMGYPATVELPDGSLLSVYYQKWPGEWWTSVCCARWRLGDPEE
ncbi:MAG: exo-alpha-sialidase [Clostridia bacterium]|nr:exo-alpha-sialidase [Clostridia bacterium]